MALIALKEEKGLEKDVVHVIPEVPYKRSAVKSWDSLSWGLWVSGIILLAVAAAVHVLYFFGLYLGILRPFTSYLKFACAVSFITGVVCGVAGFANLYFSYTCCFEAARRALTVSASAFGLVVGINVALFIWLLVSPYRGLVLSIIIIAVIGVSVGLAFACRFHRVLANPGEYLLTRGHPPQVFLNGTWTLVSADMKEYLKHKDKEMGGQLYNEMYEEQSPK